VKKLLTNGIILSRTNYGEADRILTVLTPEQGKLRLKARGVRKVKSKLAGGIELFSTSHITYIEGKGELGALISTRLIKHYGRIVQNIDRVQLGYELIKLLNKATEDHPESGYYELLEQTFAALDNLDIDTDLIHVWFQAQLLKLSGHSPNLLDVSEGQKYKFDLEDMIFMPGPNGRFTVNDIKFMRLLLSGNHPAALARIADHEKHVGALQPLLRTIYQHYLAK
jgi:DNA repair protein RecO (recombination protein O)